MLDFIHFCFSTFLSCFSKNRCKVVVSTPLNTIVKLIFVQTGRVSCHRSMNKRTIYLTAEGIDQQTSKKFSISSDVKSSNRPACLPIDVAWPAEYLQQFLLLINDSHLILMCLATAGFSGWRTLDCIILLQKTTMWTKKVSVQRFTCQRIKWVPISDHGMLQCDLTFVGWMASEVWM